MLAIQNISKLGIGQWGIGGFATHDPKNDDERQIDAIVYALKKGMNIIEVNFWNSEGQSVKLIKEAIQVSKVRREDIFLSLVVYDYKNATIGNVKEEIQSFFDVFKTTYIDSLEFPLSAIHTYGFDAITQLVSSYLERDKARFTNVTNFNLEYLKKYHEVFGSKLFAHELHFSFEVRDNEYLGIIDYANEHNIKNIVYQSLRRNRTANRNWPLLIDLAGKYGKSQNQIILNWIISKGMLPLVKSDNIKHIDENLEALTFTLSPNDIQKLDNFKIPRYRMQDIDWMVEGKGPTIFSLPNTFDDQYVTTS